MLVWSVLFGHLIFSSQSAPDWLEFATSNRSTLFRTSRVNKTLYDIGSSKPTLATNFALGFSKYDHAMDWVKVK